MRFLLIVIIAFVSGAAIIVANPTNQVGKLLQKVGLLEGWIERYSLSRVEPATPVDQLILSQEQPTELPPPPPPPPPPASPRDPMIKRLTALIENLENENNNLDLKVQALMAERAGSNTMSGDAKRYMREIDVNNQRIAEYQAQLAVAIERDNASN